MKNRRGVTVVEAVVAMAIVVAVTIAAITVLQAASLSADKDLSIAEARATAHSALQGFEHYSDIASYSAFLDELGFAFSGGEYVYNNEFVSVTVTPDYGTAQCRIYGETDGKILFDTTYKAE